MEQNGEHKNRNIYIWKFVFKKDSFKAEEEMLGYSVNCVGDLSRHLWILISFHQYQFHMN